MEIRSGWLTRYGKINFKFRLNAVFCGVDLGESSLEKIDGILLKKVLSLERGGSDGCYRESGGSDKLRHLLCQLQIVVVFLVPVTWKI